MNVARRHAVLLLVTVALLTLGALAIRAQYLRGPDGTLGEDESRLALAASGILAHGTPIMPSGKLYLRGAVNSYLTAASLAALGRHDHAVRLPNVLVGALLVPILFLFGRELAGTTAGLCLAAFGAVQPELIQWSADGWMTSLFIVVFVAVTYLCHLAFIRDRHSLQPIAGAAVAFTVLAHELGVLLVPAVLATVGIRTLRGDRAWQAGRRTLLGLGLVAASAALFVGLGLFLRSGTVAGAGGEFAHYVGPSLDPARFGRDAARWKGDYLPLAIAAAIGCAIAFRRARRHALLLYLTLAITAGAIWLIIAKDSRRYGLLLLPLIALGAAWTISEGSAMLAHRRKLDQRIVDRIRGAALVLFFAVAVRDDVRQAMRPPGVPVTTWLAELAPLGFVPGDAVLSDNPEIPAFYLGEVHYWLRLSNFERYTFREGDRLRHVYTGATLVAGAGDLHRRLLESGTTTVWYIGSDEAEDIADGIQPWLTAASTLVRRTPDGFLILRVEAGRLGPPPG
jgi:hypothetical protein